MRAEIRRGSRTGPFRSRWHGEGATRGLLADDAVLNPTVGDRWLAKQNCVYFIGSPLERFENKDLGVGISPEYLEMISQTGRGAAGVALYNYALHQMGFPRSPCDGNQPRSV